MNTLKQDLLLSRITAAIGLSRVALWVVSDIRYCDLCSEVTGFQPGSI